MREFLFSYVHKPKNGTFGFGRVSMKLIHGVTGSAIAEVEREILKDNPNYESVVVLGFFELTTKGT